MIGFHYFATRCHCFLNNKTLPVCSNRELDAGLQEAVSTLIWAAPRLQSEVAELKIVSTVCMQQSGDNIINTSCPCISFGPVLTMLSLNASFRFQISCVQNIARSMASCAGQTRLAPSMTGYFFLLTRLFKNTWNFAPLLFFSSILTHAVCSQLILKLSVEAPPKILVERYLIEIAKNYNVPYEPDAMVRVSSTQSSIGQSEGWIHALYVNFITHLSFLFVAWGVCWWGGRPDWRGQWQEVWRRRRRRWWFQRPPGCCHASCHANAYAHAYARTFQLSSSQWNCKIFLFQQNAISVIFSPPDLYTLSWYPIRRMVSQWWRVNIYRLEKVADSVLFSTTSSSTTTSSTQWEEGSPPSCPLLPPHMSL